MIGQLKVPSDEGQKASVKDTNESDRPEVDLSSPPAILIVPSSPQNTSPVLSAQEERLQRKTKDLLAQWDDYTHRIESQQTVDPSEHANQATRLSSWLLRYKYQIKLSPETLNHIRDVILGARKQIWAKFLHPSDVLLYMNIFSRLIDDTLKKTASLRPEIKELYIFETAIVSHILAAKMEDDGPPYIIDYSMHVPQTYHEKIKPSLSDKDAADIGEFRTKKSNLSFTKARLLLLEQEAVFSLNFNIVNRLTQEEQARTVAQLELCRAKSFWFDPDSDENLNKKGIEPEKIQPLFKQYVTQAEEALQALSQVCKETPEPEIKQKLSRNGR